MTKWEKERVKDVNIMLAVMHPCMHKNLRAMGKARLLV